MIEVDYGRWPIVEVTPPETVRDDELMSFLDGFDREVRSRQGGYMTVLDLRICKQITPRQRQVMTDHMQSREKDGTCLGCAMVFESRLLRGILTAMYWVHRPKYPTRVFTKVDEALAWAEQLTHDGLGDGEADEDGSGDRSMRTVPRSSRVGIEQNPAEGEWIVHLDATRSREVARDGVEVLRASGVEGFLCERRLADTISLWVGWTGPFQMRSEAIAVRDQLERLGILLTVSQWEH